MPLTKTDALDWWQAHGVPLYNECAVRRIGIKKRRQILARAKARVIAAAPHCDTPEELMAIALTAFPT